MAHATTDEDAMDFQDPDNIRNNKSPLDVDIFNQVAAAVEEDLPNDNVVSWTKYFSGGDVESPQKVPHDVKLPRDLTLVVYLLFNMQFNNQIHFQAKGCILGGRQTHILTCVKRCVNPRGCQANPGSIQPSSNQLLIHLQNVNMNVNNNVHNSVKLVCVNVNVNFNVNVSINI